MFFELKFIGGTGYNFPQDGDDSGIPAPIFSSNAEIRNMLELSQRIVEEKRMLNHFFFM